MKRFLSLGLSLLLVPAFAGAATYRIVLRDGSQVLSRDIPVDRGSVVTFHLASGGALTGLPEEEIVSIQPDTGKGSRTVATATTERTQSTPLKSFAVRGKVSAIQTLARPLEPGEILVLGPTGSGQGVQGGSGTDGANAAAGMNAGTGASGAGSPSAVPPGTFANGQPFVPAPGDLARAPSGNPPTMGPNGFPLNGNPTTVNVGPTGTPVVAGSSQTAPLPGSNQPIGPNGFPTGATGPTAVQPGTNQIGPNGTPVLAQPGTPGATQPNIGPNGTPVLAQPGAPGSGQPVIAPNGTPATGQPGAPSSGQPNTAPNGTPASPPAGGASPNK